MVFVIFFSFHKGTQANKTLQKHHKQQDIRMTKEEDEDIRVTAVSTKIQELAS